MIARPATSGAPGVLDRIHRATNAHDLDALADCFTAEYTSLWPQHPARGFSGVDQVRQNWARIFAAVPDITTEIKRWVLDGDQAWAEWEYSGTRVDGAAFLMRGVIIVIADSDRAREATFYFEPVELDGIDAAAAIGRLTGPPNPPASRATS